MGEIFSLYQIIGSFNSVYQAYDKESNNHNHVSYYTVHVLLSM